MSINTERVVCSLNEEMKRTHLRKYMLLLRLGFVSRQQSPAASAVICGYFYKLSHSEQYQILPALLLVAGLFADQCIAEQLLNISRFQFSQGLLLRWTASAYEHKNMKTLCQQLDEALIHGKVLSGSRRLDQKLLLAQQHQKSARQTAFKLSMHFFQYLTSLTVVLNSFPRDKCLAQLKLRLAQLQLLSSSSSKGISFPFYENIANSNRVIVNILTELSICFYTKTKVPFRVVFQTLLDEDCPLDVDAIPFAQTALLTNFDFERNQLAMNNLLLSKYKAEQKQDFKRLSKTAKVSPPVSAFQQSNGYLDLSFESILKRVREQSKYSSQKSYQLRAFVVKGGDDLRQERFAMAVIDCIACIFKESKVDCWLRPFQIYIHTNCSGLVEYLWDTKSLDAIKKKSCIGLKQIFLHQFNTDFGLAQVNFAYSLAGYSIVCYILLLKDRHNGNILLDKEGHLIHIDYSFILGCSPGNNHGFETAPFKFTEEYLQLLDGKGSSLYKFFQSALVAGMLAVSRQAELILNLIELFMASEQLSCRKRFVSKELKERLMLGLSPEQVESRVKRLIDESYQNYSTGWYDNFQYYTNGILY